MLLLNYTVNIQGIIVDLPSSIADAAIDIFIETGATRER